MAEGEIIQTLPQLDQKMRHFLIDHLRRVQQFSNDMKGIAGDRAIVERYCVADWPDLEMNSSTTQDVESLMEDIVDIYKQMKLCRNKIRGRGSANLRDSGISECSERLSQLSVEDVELSHPVENEEDHNERVLERQAEASLSARSQRSGTRRPVAEETDKGSDEAETNQPQ